ncbi:SpoIIE family protein phosphatase [Streptomyces sp. NPDC058664]|uniref:ATP-binding SpoIIE family protein phosphatase n=1 Tax=unclassified Streptomyces TaxID=2593676 RepID=UPI003660D3BF
MASDRLPESPSGPDAVAAALLDGRGRVVWWSRGAAELLGWSGQDMAGTPVRSLLHGPVSGARAPRAGAGHARKLRLRHRSGRLVDADVRLVAADPDAEVLVLASPTGGPDGPGGWDEARDLARALLSQSALGVAHLDMGLRLVQANAAFEVLRPEGADDGWFLDLPDAGGTATVRATAQHVAATGACVTGVAYRLDPGHAERTLPLSCFRVDDPLGEPVGVAIVTGWSDEPPAPRLRDTYRRALEIGESLDVVQVAQDLMDVLVPALGDLACVDFPDDVLQGRDPPYGYPGQEASAPRRVAVKSADGRWPARLIQVGEPTPTVPDRPELAAKVVGDVLVADAAFAREVLGHDPELIARLVPEGMRDSLGCPLYRGGRFFGYATVYRVRTAVPFDDADVKLLRDLCARTALALDNAFRFAREHQTAVVLQRSLLPPAATESAAAETAGIYVPAGGSVSVGGDWYDAFPMSSLRIGLVVGDVIGHGLEAAATMARLRTAVQTLADLDLPPDELLTHLDDLVQRMRAEAEEPDTLGGSCLFAVYDPVTRICQLASAGHAPPALALPDGGVGFVPVVPGPLLGVGDNPFEVCSVELPPGSVLALYSDGMVQHGHDSEAGMARLGADLAELCRGDRPLDRIGADLVARHPSPDQPEDDVTLLLARTRAVAEDATAAWEFPADPAAVQDARARVNARLEEWGLDGELLFTTELIVSELVTNAIRYAGGPVGLRLIRDRVLVCEVSDPSNTQPRLRRALTTDEGGRGLFMIAQLTTRWGCRYGARGKTIWTEQPLSPPRGG